MQKKICQSSHKKYYLLYTEKCFQKQQINVYSFYKKHNFICAISLLISPKTTEKKFVDDHKQKYVEITKDCLWNELQNYFVESTGKKINEIQGQKLSKSLGTLQMFYL